MEESGMRHLAGTSMVALAVAALLASLSLVSWRQVTALEALERVDSLRQEHVLDVAVREELEGRILHLESYGRVAPDAERLLGMRKAAAGEMVHLPVEGR